MRKNRVKSNNYASLRTSACRGFSHLVLWPVKQVDGDTVPYLRCQIKEQVVRLDLQIYHSAGQNQPMSELLLPPLWNVDPFIFPTCFPTLSALRLWAREAAADVIPTERCRGKPVSAFFSGRPALFTDPRPAGLDSRGAHIWRDTRYNDSLFTFFLCCWSRTLKVCTVQLAFPFIYVISISSISQGEKHCNSTKLWNLGCVKS